MCFGSEKFKSPSNNFVFGDEINTHSFEIYLILNHVFITPHVCSFGVFWYISIFFVLAFYTICSQLLFCSFVIIKLRSNFPTAPHLGPTHTMMGSAGQLGIIPRIVDAIFAGIRAQSPSPPPPHM